MEHEREVRILLTVAVNEQAKAQSQRAVEQSLEQMAAASEKSSQKIARDSEKATVRQAVAIQGIQQKAAAQSKVLAEKTAADIKLIHEKLAGNIAIIQQKIARGPVQEQARVQRLYEAATMRQQVAFEQVGMRLERVGMGALRVGRGLALLWAGDNKQKAEEYQKTIVKIVAAFDLVHGAVSIIRNLAAIWRVVETATKAATAAQLAYAAVTALTPGIGGGKKPLSSGGVGAQFLDTAETIAGYEIYRRGFGLRGRVIAGLGKAQGALKAGGAAVAGGITEGGAAVGLGSGASMAVAAPLVGIVATVPMYAEMGYRKLRGWDAMGGPYAGAVTGAVGFGGRLASYVYAPGTAPFREQRRTAAAFARMQDPESEYGKAQAARVQQAELEERLALTYLATRMSGEAQLRELQFAAPGMTLAKQRAEAQSQLDSIGRVNAANLAVPAESRNVYQQKAITLGVQEELRLRLRVQDVMLQQERSVEAITSRQRTLAQEIENQQRGMKQQFGAMSRPEQSRFLRLLEKQRAGISTPREDEEILRLAPTGGATAKAIEAKRERAADVAGWGRTGFDQEAAALKQASERDAEKAIEAIRGNRVKLAEIGKVMAAELLDCFKEYHKTMKAAVEEAKREARADNAATRRGREQLDAADRAVTGVGER